MSGQSLYEVLGVEPTASTETIKTTYRALAKRYHPDTHPDRPEYAEILKAITAAYSILGNQIKRAAYDLRTASGGDTPQPEPADEWEPSAEELRNIYQHALPRVTCHHPRSQLVQ
jgi:curved DNA-binding protein CbpA